MKNAPIGVAAVAVLALLGGCGEPNSTASADDSLVDAAWLESNGNEVSQQTVNVIRGPDHCDWESSLWMHVGWPPGTEADTAAEIRQYVRDPDDVLPVETATSLDTDATLPEDATATGFSSDGGVDLWLGEDEGDEAIYVAFEDRTERWPKTAEVIACD